MTPSQKLALAVAGTALAGAATMVALVQASPQAPPATPPATPLVEQPALTVSLVQPRADLLPLHVAATGNVMAWQEASLGAEANGLRLVEVRANVGDEVRRGQVLAVFASDTVEAELAQRRAAVAEAAAAHAEAAGNAQRARALQDSGAWSAQQIQQALVAERTAQARWDAARALEAAQALRLRQTRLLAPDDGLVSARSATLGAVLPAGQELFRLVRGGRLEWRAEVAAPELARLRPGQPVRVTLVGGEVLQGRLRTLAPLVDTQTRNGLAYVDLPRHGAARAGMFARGEFALGHSAALTLPRSAVQLRDGFSVVMRLGPGQRVAQARVQVGRQAGDRVEILAGLDAADRVVAAGTAFLADNDPVRVVAAP